MSDSYRIIRFAGRKLPEEYRALIYSKFLRSLRFGNEYFRLIDQESYFKTYHIYIDSLLRREQSAINLAVLSDDYDVVLGWALMEPRRLHYVYVNKDNRKIGIGTSLVSDGFDSFSHLTNIGISIWSSKYPDTKFNPF